MSAVTRFFSENWPHLLAVVAMLALPFIIGGFIWFWAWSLDSVIHWSWPNWQR